MKFSMGEYYRLHVKQSSLEFEIVGNEKFIETFYKKIIVDFKIEQKSVLKEGFKSVQLHSLEKNSIRDFYLLKDPKNHNQNIMVIAYWLMKNKNLEEFKGSKEILDAYNEIRIKEPNNIHQHINSLQKYGLIMKNKKDNTYLITLKGMKYVENEFQLEKKGE